MEDKPVQDSEQPAAAAGDSNQSPPGSDVTSLPPSQSDVTAQQDTTSQVTSSDVTTPTSVATTTPVADSTSVPTNGTEVRPRHIEVTVADKLHEHDLDLAAGINPSAAAAVVAAAAVEPTNGIHKVSAHEMDMAELKVKILCLEKNNTALKMELKCAELQVAAKEKLDTKKTRLIELLDTKLSAMEKKNVRLIEMVEQMVKDKETQSQRLVNAAKTLEDAAARLTDSERIRGQLSVMNTELKTMLENVEGKGSQLAKLAKEKVLKYKEENERMQKELDDRKAGDGSEIQQQASNGSRDESKTSDADAGNSIIDAIEKMEEFDRQIKAALTIANDWKQADSIDNLKAALSDVGRASADQLTATSGFLSRLKTSTDENGKSAPSTSSTSPAAAAAAADGGDLAEKIATKDREIEGLREELTRLKAAIGQLVGLNLSGLATSSAGS